MTPTEKKCSRCGHPKHPFAFRLKSTSPDGLADVCNACVSGNGRTAAKKRGTSYMSNYSEKAGSPPSGSK